MLHTDSSDTRPRLRILIVEDEALIRWAVAEALTGAGHHVIEAADAATAETTETSETPASENDNG